VVLHPDTPDFMAAAAYAVPFAVGQKFDAMQAQIDSAAQYQGRAHLAVTEWLYNNKGAGERNFINESPSSRNEGGAVMIASTFNTFFRHNAQIKLVNLTGLMEFAGIWKRREQVFVTPAYYVFQMYSSAKNETVLPVTSDSGTYDVANGIQGYPDLRDVPYVDVAATLSPDHESLTLFCINRSLTQDVRTTVNLIGFQARDVVKVEQIKAISRYVMNDELEPKQVVPRTLSMATDHGRTLQIILPQESVTVVRLHAQRTADRN
jgi:alpha-N-arabinofuranosidase